MKTQLIAFSAAVFFLAITACTSTTAEVSTGPLEATIDFTQTLQDWDGFGVNYVEVAQAIDYKNEPQEYGGFSLLTEEERQEIIEMTFGEDGIKPAIVKMFFDPFQQETPGGTFDHESTTKWMRYFVKEGIRLTEERGGDDISIITTMYGPPAWATQQKILRGRDLDPLEYENLANYMIQWVKYLVEVEKLPIDYLSLHNEGDSPNRWPLDGSHGNIGQGHDYNAFWRPWEVAHFLEFMPDMMKEAGLAAGLTPGECSNWGKFKNMCYHWAIHDNQEAMENIALITSHGFGTESSIISEPNDLLRLKRPDLHSWTTSMTWGKKHTTDYEFIDLIRMNIYNAKVNAVIPWAYIQTLTWVGGDPNPGTAFFVSEDGEYEVKPQYYFFKQLARAGQRGMAVATVDIDKEADVKLIAFTSNGTDNPDAFLVLNKAENAREVKLTLQGGATSYQVFRTGPEEQYAALDDIMQEDGVLTYTAPAGSLTTFFATK
jgi:O-glycosyl hydrolase